MESYDTIVIGTGGVGSATLYRLAKRGNRVLGLDRHPQAHACGSSHGQTRMIRQAYFEHPDYVPLLLRAYDLWRDLEAEAQVALFHQVGLLEVGPTDGVMIPGVMQSVSQHGLEIEELTVSEARHRFPFHIPDQMKVVLEPTGGYLMVEQCVEAQLQLAIAHGATWKQQAVLDWTASKHEVRVRTDAATYVADRLIVCGGSWSASLLRGVGVELQILEKHQYWFDTPSTDTSELPNYFFETPLGDFYGFPKVGQSGLKLAQHGGGRRHDKPFDLSMVRDDADLEKVRRFAKSYVEFELGDLLAQKACMYTMSPDGHFIIDRHPRHENVYFAAGMSGHGFKFVPILGLVLAQLASGEAIASPVDFLSLDRFGVTRQV